jgi:muramoyltetrapeptide carboxypeptidase LdcA involved in peptidoglycan recycling
MRITLSANCVIQNFPEAKGLKEGESIRTIAPSSSSPTGEVVVNIKRMTQEYFSVAEIK